MGLSFPFFNVFLQEDLSTPTQMIGVIFFIAQIVTVPATVLAPAMVRSFGPVKTIVPCRILGSFSLAYLGFVGDIWLALPLILVSATAEAITTPSEMTFATQVMPRKYWGRIQSVRVTGFQIPSGVASFVAGFLIVTYGYWMTFALSGGLKLTSALIFLAAFKDTDVKEPTDTTATDLHVR